ncbi:MAG: site-specific tyrosine recombinase XerC [Spirochaetes bacterium ADurb.Bin315]|jgi:integrase|nr:MAG: site-specific tyrosine recombinase XerC [Spirochaetes bacterium ADurb.Bin315]
MSKLRKPPTVYKVRHSQRNGESVEDKEYSFRISYQGKRRVVKTGFAQKRKAQEHVASIYASEQKFSNLINELFIQSPIDKEPQLSDSNTESLGTVKETIITQGWLEVESNPKRMAHLKQEKNYGTNQARKIAYSLKHIFFATDQYSWFANKPLIAISRADAQELSNELYRNRTYRNVLCEGHPDISENNGDYRINIISLKSFFTFYYEELAIIENNPFSKIKIPKSKHAHTQKPIFTELQLRLAFNKDRLNSIEIDDSKEKAKWNTFLSSTYFKAFKFIALTGMRSGEVRALQWKQISNDILVTINQAFKENSTDISVIGKPKWDKTRKIILCDSAYEIIKDKSNDAGGFVFQNEKGKPLSAKTWSDKFNYFISVLNKKVFFGDSPFTSHSFRATLNTLLIMQANVPESLIRKYLGWSESPSLSAVQEKHYTSFSEVDTLKIAEGIERIYSGRPMSYQYISSQERDDINTIFPNWEFFRNAENMLSIERKPSFESITKIKDYLIKKINNYILFDDRLDDCLRTNLIQTCQKSLALTMQQVDDLDIFYTRAMKDYISENKDTLPPSINFITSLLLDHFYRLRELELQNEK